MDMHTNLTNFIFVTDCIVSYPSSGVIPAFIDLIFKYKVFIEVVVVKVFR